MKSFSVYFRMDVEGRTAAEALDNAERELNKLTDAPGAHPVSLDTDHMTDEMGEEINLDDVPLYDSPDA